MAAVNGQTGIHPDEMEQHGWKRVSDDEANDGRGGWQWRAEGKGGGDRVALRALKPFVSEDGHGNRPMTDAEQQMILDHANKERQLENAKAWARGNQADPTVQFLAWYHDANIGGRKATLDLSTPEAIKKAQGKAFTINGEKFRVAVDKDGIVHLVDETVSFPHADAIGKDGEIPVDAGSIKNARGKAQLKPELEPGGVAIAEDDIPFNVRSEDEEKKTAGRQMGLLGERSDGGITGKRSGSLFGDTSRGAASKLEETPAPTEEEKLRQKWKDSPSGLLFNVRGLSDEERAKQDEFRRQLDPRKPDGTRDLQKLRQVDDAYDKLPASRHGRVLNSDTARQLSEHYPGGRDEASRVARRENTSWTNPPAGSYVHDRFMRTMDSMAAEGKKPNVLFLAGGAGSGKSTATDLYPSLRDQADIVVDSNLARLPTAERMIQKTLAADGRAVIAFVYRPYDRVVGDMLDRGHESGRYVGLGADEGNLAWLHYKAQETLRALHEKYADDPRVLFRAIDNSGKPGEAVPAGMDRLVGSGGDLRYTSAEELTRHDEPAIQAYRSSGKDPRIADLASGQERSLGEQGGSGLGRQPQQESQAGLPDSVNPPEPSFNVRSAGDGDKSESDRIADDAARRIAAKFVGTNLGELRDLPEETVARRVTSKMMGQAVRDVGAEFPGGPEAFGPIREDAIKRARALIAEARKSGFDQALQEWQRNDPDVNYKKVIRQSTGQVDPDRVTMSQQDLIRQAMRQRASGRAEGLKEGVQLRQEVLCVAAFHSRRVI